MAPHPTIEPWLRPVVRRGDEVQFGLIEGGPVVAGVTAREAALLSRLDGSLSYVDSYALASAAGVSQARWRRVLALCSSLGVFRHSAGVAPAPAGPAPHTGHVVVDGLGALAQDVVELLGGEVGALAPRVTHGRIAVDELLAAPESSHPADVVVLVAGEALDPRRGDVWLARGIPVLPVVATGPWGAVGPLVGTTPTGPCLWCLDLHRTDRDESWPVLLAQLWQPSPVVVDAGPVAAPEPAIARLVTGAVALLVEQVIAGEAPPLGVSVEVRRPWPRMDHRRWARHPRCQRHTGHVVTGTEPAGELVR